MVTHVSNESSSSSSFFLSSQATIYRSIYLRYFCCHSKTCNVDMKLRKTNRGRRWKKNIWNNQQRFRYFCVTCTHFSDFAFLCWLKYGFRLVTHRKCLLKINFFSSSSSISMAFFRFSSSKMYISLSYIIFQTVGCR